MFSNNSQLPQSEHWPGSCAMPQPRDTPTTGDPLRGVPSLLSSRRQRSGCQPGCHHGNKRRNRVLALAAGLLCCSSTTPHTTSAFSLVPARAARPLGGRTALGSSVGGAAAVGFSSRSAFAGLRVADGCYQHAGGAKLGNRNSRGPTGGVGGLSMGIPKLFRWLTDQYPVISQRLDQGLNEVSERVKGSW